MRVLVTGGAKRLGAAIVRRLAADGHRVVIHYGRSGETASALAAETGGASVQGDLAALDGADDLWARAVDAAGGAIDWLVNSASEFSFDRPEQVDVALAARLMAVNCTMPTLLAQALAAQRRDGAVVNILDQKLANPNPDYFSYTLSKAALSEATVLMAQAHAPHVRVNAVAPGLTLPSGEQTDEQFARVASRNLLRHPVGAGRVADAVAWLLGAQSVTGQTVYVDAGQRFVRSERDVMFDG